MFIPILHIDMLLQVIIDSQPLTVAVLASLLFGESIGLLGSAGLVLGVVGLALLEVCIFILQNLSNFGIALCIRRPR